MRVATPPQKIASQQSFGVGQPGFTVSSRQPKSRKRFAAFSQPASTSGSTTLAKPRFADHATRSPVSGPLRAFT